MQNTILLFVMVVIVHHIHPFAHVFTISIIHAALYNETESLPSFLASKTRNFVIFRTHQPSTTNTTNTVSAAIFHINLALYIPCIIITVFEIEFSIECGTVLGSFNKLTAVNTKIRYYHHNSDDGGQP
jgi:hypothetical protein